MSTGMAQPNGSSATADTPPNDTGGQGWAAPAPAPACAAADGDAPGTPLITRRMIVN